MICSNMNQVLNRSSVFKFVYFTYAKLIHNNSLKTISFLNHNTIFARISAFI
jgi:hypothetical protein